MLKSTALFLLLLVAAPPAAAVSPVKARTLSGLGIMLISKEQPKLSLFKEPSIGRIATIDASLLPLSQSIHPPEGFISAIVTTKKKGWFRIFYDDGEREGWIEGHSSYLFYRWEELLKDRQVILLGGLKKEYYQLRKSPDFSLEPLEPVGKGVRVTALRAEGDWVKARTDSRAEGWLRWRDDNARLVISLNL